MDLGQDWWNLVIWEQPELLAPLHCSFNYQVCSDMLCYDMP